MSRRLAYAAALLAIVGWASLAPPRALAQILPPPPLPGGSLIVTVTSPASGATVSGTVPVNASVSIVGSLTVANVDFFVDGNFIGSDSTASYSVPWNTTTANNGSHTLTAVARDALGVLWTSDPVTVMVSNDTTRPTVTINQAAAQADPSNAAPINFTVVFSEPVGGFTGTDVTISGTAGGTKTVALTGGPSTYNVAVSGVTTAGTVIAAIAAGLAQDAAGNTNTASNSTDNSVTFDATAPTVTINQAASQADPTNAAPINFTVVFSEPVSGFTGADVTISGTAGGTKTVTVSGGPSSYTVAVSGMTTGGTVIATIAAGVGQDAAGNLNTASTSTDNTVTWVPPDTTPPTVTINQAAGQADPTSASPIKFTVVFSEPVSGFTGTDVSIGGTAQGTKTVSVTGGPSTYNAAVSGMTSSGTVSATIPAGGASDTAGNPNTASTSTDNSVQFNLPDTIPPAPTITSFSPTSGPVGATVAISGTNFTGATAVTFNGVSASFTVTSATSMTATVPSGATSGPISVTTPGGTATSSSSFTVLQAPTISTFSPTSGPVGTSVTINGSNFTGATAVKFNGVSAAFIVDSATSIRAEVPAGATTGPISVTTPGGTATSASAFTVQAPPPPPTITSFTPASGPVGTVVTITGTNFSGATAVTFNTVSAAFLVDSATSIRAEVPAGATTGPISVTTPGGTAASTSNFTVTAPSAEAPTITSFSPTNGPVGTNVTISGTNFTGATAVAFNGVSTTSFTVNASGTAITATVPSGATTGPISVTTPAGTATSASNFTVETAAPPTVTRSEESAATFAGTGWTLRGSEIAAFSGGTAGSSNVAGDTSSFTFTGTAVSWIGLKCNICGIASVSIDGGAAAPVDTAGPAAVGSLGLTSEAVFTASGLAPGTHTVVITVTGTTTSGDAHIVVDAFDVTGTGSDVTRVEENNAAVSYIGTWQEFFDTRVSGGSIKEAFAAGARATLSFTGKAVSWIGARGDFGGIANVLLDGVLQGQVDTFCDCGTGTPRAEAQVVLFTASGLDPTGSHTLTIEATGTANPAAINTGIIVDAFDVTR